jgi:hypothetical protein
LLWGQFSGVSDSKRIERKRKLRGDLVAYILVNSFLVVVGAIRGDGYFWGDVRIPG